MLVLDISIVQSIVHPFSCFVFTDVAVDYVEGGKYISSEFQLGQVYIGEEGNDNEEDDEILYRPMYTCVPHAHKHVTNTKDKKRKTRDIETKEELINEQNDVVQSRQKSFEKKKSFKNRSSERLKSEVVTVDEVSNSQPWEVVALKK